MVRKIFLGFGLLAVLLIGAIWTPLTFRNSDTTTVALVSETVVDEAPEAPAAPPKLEDHPAAQSLILFNAIYDAEYEAKDLAAFERQATGIPVVWLGKIKDVPATGEHLVVVPLVPKDGSNFDVFVVAKLDDPNTKLKDVAEAGNLIILKGVITSFGTNGPIVTAEQFMIGKPKNDDAKVE